jgi:hypothetical protein
MTRLIIIGAAMVIAAYESARMALWTTANNRTRGWGSSA